MIKDSSNKYDIQLADLERKISLARGEEKVDLIIKNTRIINVFSGKYMKLTSQLPTESL